jgi:hypothetical protein
MQQPVQAAGRDRRFSGERSLFGDNAYVNTLYMATPYKGVKNGSKDAYNFYHSQLQINIECAFGQLVHRFGILWRPLSSTISLHKVTKLVLCLCCLHNFYINKQIGPDPDSGLTQPTYSPFQQCDDGPEESLFIDRATILAHGGIPLERVERGGIVNRQSPEQLLHDGHHFGDVSLVERCMLSRRFGFGIATRALACCRFEGLSYY